MKAAIFALPLAAADLAPLRPMHPIDPLRQPDIPAGVCANRSRIASLSRIAACWAHNNGEGGARQPLPSAFVVWPACWHHD